jgi:hypothetical protein
MVSFEPVLPVTPGYTGEENLYFYIALKYKVLHHL